MTTPETLADLLNALNTLEQAASYYAHAAPTQDMREQRMQGLTLMADSIRAALRAQPAEGPRCATCRHWDGEHTRAKCMSPLRHKFISLTLAFETRRDFGCTLHEPLPPAPGGAKE